jgi:hypothetical protein
MWRMVVVAGLIVLYRYSLRLATPQADWWYLEEYTLRVVRWLRIEGNMFRAWLYGLAHYVPSERVRQRWQYLRTRVSQGLYGEAGT